MFAVRTHCDSHFCVFVSNGAFTPKAVPRRAARCLASRCVAFPAWILQRRKRRNVPYGTVLIRNDRSFRNRRILIAFKLQTTRLPYRSSIRDESTILELIFLISSTAAAYMVSLKRTFEFHSLPGNILQFLLSLCRHLDENFKNSKIIQIYGFSRRSCDSMHDQGKLWHDKECNSSTTKISPRSICEFPERTAFFRKFISCYGHFTLTKKAKNVRNCISFLSK